MYVCLDGADGSEILVTVVTVVGVDRLLTKPLADRLLTKPLVLATK